MIINSFSELKSISSVVNIAIGIFDGVHKGHAAVISRACAEPGVALAMSFDPHPLSLINPQRAPLMLSSLNHRQTLIERLGAKYFMALPFDQQRANQLPEQFLDEIVSSCELGSICVGDDFKFGKDRKGDSSLIQNFAEKYGFKLRLIERVKDETGLVISSSRIRELLANSEIRSANNLLGRKFSVSGFVKKGNMLGREIGFPTANVMCDVPEMMQNGVYVVHVIHDDKLLYGIANLGVRPTVSDEFNNKPVLEVHIFDFDNDIYNDELEILFVDFLRNEKKFKNLEELKLQIKKDTAVTKKILNSIS